ncbi:hypothetical protein Hanom_Chr16g01522861 [Helianthus anomalus]
MKKPEPLKGVSIRAPQGYSLKELCSLVDCKATMAPRRRGKAMLRACCILQICKGMMRMRGVVIVPLECSLCSLISFLASQYSLNLQSPFDIIYIIKVLVTQKDAWYN